MNVDFNRIARNVSESFQGSALTEGYQLFNESQDLVPIDTGELKESGKVRKEGKAVVVEYTADHAALVHEHIHQRHVQGQSKYLEDPVTRSRVSGRWAQEATTAIRERL